jgi:hypothetical protein
LLNLELRYEQKQYQTQTKERGRVEPNQKGKIDLVPNLCFSTQEGIQNMDMFKKINLFFVSHNWVFFFLIIILLMTWQ